ncbi:MAG: exodeoxyribonuclease VII large subunit [Elusimicrobia bacterium]|nr:MAG: exodeoxyribonuclease VII large subunit [Elusimicrobiota bacterium]
MPEAKALTVSQLNRRIQGALEETFPAVWVEGEVSRPIVSGAGHVYFDLKDAESVLSSVMWRGTASALKFRLEQGLAVSAWGRVTTYVPKGRYQLVVDRLAPAGAGALQLAFEQLKAKLQAEGLFDESRKRPLPPFPKVVGLVTSAQGAAVHDMVSVLSRRCPGLLIRLLPVPVQGPDAAPRIAAAIEDFNARFPDTEVLLVGRGGGSIEDLWAFNEGVVARAIAASLIPVVSAVGHETDFTIADSPSAAAELAVPDTAALRERADSASTRLGAAMGGLLREVRERLASLSRSPLLRDPRRIFEMKAQRVDELAGRLAPALERRLAMAEERLKRLQPAPGMRRALDHASAELRRLMGQLDALSPLRVLERGYAIAFKEDGKSVLRSTRDAKPGDAVTVRLTDGSFKAKVTP